MGEILKVLSRQDGGKLPLERMCLLAANAEANDRPRSPQFFRRNPLDTLFSVMVDIMSTQSLLERHFRPIACGLLIAPLLYLAILFTPAAPVFEKPAKAQDVVTIGAIIAGAQGILQQITNIGPTWGGDFAGAANSTAGQISSLITQFQQAVGTDLTKPLNSFGYDIQDLGNRLQFATDSLNQILSHQRNCADIDVADLISGVRSVGLRVASKIPFAGKDAPSVYSFRFIGHDSEAVPITGGQLQVDGYNLFSKRPPDLNLVDEAGHAVALTASRGTSNDDFITNIPGAILQSNAGKILNLNIAAHTEVKKDLIEHKDVVTSLTLPFSVPQAYTTVYKVDAIITYTCSQQPPDRNLPAVTFDFHNNSCEDRHNVGDTKTPVLPSGGNIVPGSAFISGWHYVNWPDGHSSPNTRNQTSVSPSFTSTTVSAAGWLDTASCGNIGPIHHFFNDTFWQAAIVPECRLTLLAEQTATGTIKVPAALPTTIANINLPTICNEPGPHSFSYVVTPIVNGVANPPLYSSPVRTESEKGVHDSVILGPVTIAASWNPQPINGFSQVALTISQPTCGQ